VNRSIGILGGLGPLAGAHFYRRLIELTPAQDDAGHLPVVLISEPSIPSRREHLLAGGTSPVPALQGVAKRLEGEGCSVIVVPSTTTHAFHAEISKAVRVPVLNLLSAATESLDGGGSRNPAVISTRATVETQIYGPYFRERDMAAIYPPTDVQDRIDELIDAVKAGVDMMRAESEMRSIVTSQWLDEADGVLFACTETPLIAPNNFTARPTVSATDVLARAAICAVGLTPIG